MDLFQHLMQVNKQMNKLKAKHKNPNQTVQYGKV